ncbi:hypothetical protein B1219_04135 [Pseudomonas ogarae]|nr:hypothetical protein B1219_04135 [Pseudomonas ogarae]OPG80167.1 hypothetical protein B1218_06595 [Pseudomonas ogarae]
MWRGDLAKRRPAPLGCAAPPNQATQAKKGTDLFSKRRESGFVGFTRFINKSVPIFLRAALLSENVKVQGVTVKVGVPAPGKTGVAEFKVEPWSKK